MILLEGKFRGERALRCKGMRYWDLMNVDSITMSLLWIEWHPVAGWCNCPGDHADSCIA